MPQRPMTAPKRCHLSFAVDVDSSAFDSHSFLLWGQRMGSWYSRSIEKDEVLLQQFGNKVCETRLQGTSVMSICSFPRHQTIIVCEQYFHNKSRLSRSCTCSRRWYELPRILRPRRKLEVKDSTQVRHPSCGYPFKNANHDR